MKSKVKSKPSLQSDNSNPEIPTLMQNTVTGTAMLPELVKTEVTPGKAYEENMPFNLNKSPHRRNADGSEMRESGDIVSTV